MMSTPSSSARLPPTSPQVTASVVKFRCLYTHDLRRKSKRWHDGYLRYHKFNKRVMVYDDQGNFIGDHHWRAADEVQDGDEMELDKGVLIEVTENMGTTETDITNLYEKKISSQGSPQAKDQTSQVQRTTNHTPASAPIRSSGSSQPFRSLNDLLGIKKTPIGHLVSPYEERNPPQPTLTGQAPERTHKRQKTSSAVHQNSEIDPPAQSHVIDLTDSNHRAPVQQKTNLLRKELPRTVTNILPVNPHQRTNIQPKQVQPQRPGPSSPSFSAPVSSDPTSSLPTPEELIRTITRTIQPSRPPSKGSEDGPPPMQPPKSPRSSSKSNSTAERLETEASESRGTLCENPESVDRETSSMNPSRPVRERGPGHSTASKGSCPNARREPEHPTIPQEPVRAVTNYIQPIQPANNQAPTTGSSSTAAPSLTNVTPPTNMPPPPRPSLALPPGAPTTALRIGSGKPRKKLMYSALLPSASRTPSPVTSDTPPNNAIRESVTEPREQSSNVGPSNSSTATEEFTPSSSTQFIFDEMMDGSGFKSPAVISKLSGKRSLDSPLRKSVSDPTALTAHQGSSSLANRENEPQEQGPWTSEALDLFDFWPVGRPKPID